MKHAVSIARTIRLSLLVLVCLATWELCARIQDQVQLGVPLWALRYQSSPLYAYRGGAPHGIPRAIDGTYRMNSLGFRGPDPIVGRETILCLGASETFGVGASDGSEYPRQLERRLNAGFRAPRYQVLNAALPGERIEAITATLPRTLRAAHPAYVILYVSPGSVIWTRARWDQLHPTDTSNDPPTTTYGRLRSLSHFESVFHQALPEPILALERRDKVRKAIAGAPDPPTAHLPEKNFVAFRHELERTIAVLTAAHVRVVIVTHATRFGPDVTRRDAQLENFFLFYPVLSAAGLADTEHRFNAILRDVARQHGFALVDAAHRLAPGAENFTDFFHFTDRGNARMAALVGEAVLADDQQAR